MCGRTCTRVSLQGTTQSGRNFNIQISLCVQPDNEWTKGYNKMLLLRFDVKMIDIQPWPEQLLVSSTENLWANCKLKLKSCPQVNEGITMTWVIVLVDSHSTPPPSLFWLLQAVSSAASHACGTPPPYVHLCVYGRECVYVRVCVCVGGGGM